MLKLFTKRYSPRERLLFRFLRKNELFEKLTDKEIEEFVPYLHLRTYAENEVVFFRNDPSQALYIIKSGHIKLNLDVNDQFEELLMLHPGASFGDNSILENTVRNYNAISCSDDCELYVIPQVNILDIFESNIHIKAKMVSAVAQYYDKYLTNMSKVYRESFGLFDLGQVYIMSQRKHGDRPW